LIAKDVSLAEFSVGSSKQIVVMSSTKTYIVMVGMINNSVSVTASDTIIKGIISWESGFAGYNIGRLLFLNSAFTEIWGVKVGDESPDSLDGGQGLEMFGKGATGMYIYWRGNKWCCVSSNTMG
jgi:hypothetical protein